MELKQWRRVYGICPSYEMCITECREGYDAQIAEYKRLLKAAVEDIAFILSYACSDEEMCCEECPTENHACNKWRYADEALKLLNDEK